LYRALPAAVAALDATAVLRDQLTMLCDVGPWQYPMAAWLKRGASLAQLEGATGHDDTIVTRIIEDPFRRTIREPQPRTGGRWLSMVNSGYALRLNNSDEAFAVLAAAQADVDPDTAAHDA
jgi:hypothetical protein